VQAGVGMAECLVLLQPAADCCLTRMLRCRLQLSLQRQQWHHLLDDGWRLGVLSKWANGEGSIQLSLQASYHSFPHDFCTCSLTGNEAG
jgi:hypothetical protein